MHVEMVGDVPDGRGVPMLSPEGPDEIEDLLLAIGERSPGDSRLRPGVDSGWHLR
jgi:hypothetical protein